MSDLTLDPVDFELSVGETRSFQITVNRTNNTVDPPVVTPVDLRLGGTEIVYAVELRRGTAVLFTKQVGSGITVPGGSPGNIMTVALDGTEFPSSTKDEVYDYVVRVKEPTGPTTSDIVRGRLLVHPAVAVTP